MFKNKKNIVSSKAVTLIMTYIIVLNLTFLPGFSIFISKSLRNNFTLNAHVIALIIVIILADINLALNTYPKLYI